LRFYLGDMINEDDSIKSQLLANYLKVDELPYFRASHSRIKFPHLIVMSLVVR